MGLLDSDPEKTEQEIKAATKQEIKYRIAVVAICLVAALALPTVRYAINPPGDVGETIGRIIGFAIATLFCPGIIALVAMVAGSKQWHLILAITFGLMALLMLIFGSMSR